MLCGAIAKLSGPEGVLFKLSFQLLGGPLYFQCFPMAFGSLLAASSFAEACALLQGVDSVPVQGSVAASESASAAVSAAVVAKSPHQAE